MIQKLEHLCNFKGGNIESYSQLAIELVHNFRKDLGRAIPACCDYILLKWKRVLLAIFVRRKESKHSQQTVTYWILRVVVHPTIDGPPRQAPFDAFHCDRHDLLVEKSIRESPQPKQSLVFQETTVASLSELEIGYVGGVIKGIDVEAEISHVYVIEVDCVVDAFLERAI